MKKVIILYHKNCTDGFASAWAAWKKFGRRARYIGVVHQAPPPKKLVNKEVYMIDFTYPRKHLEQLVKNNKRVTAIDHHITAEKEVKMTENYLYSLNHSGAVLSWKYFHPKKKVPRLLEYIEDFDLWKFKKRGTKKVLAALELSKFDFNHWNKLAKIFENSGSLKKFLEKGEVILEYQKVLTDKLVRQADIIKFCGIRTLAVNSPLFESQLGEALYKKLPPMAVVWSETGGVKKFSLRSSNARRANVAKIAEKYGGGGHTRASGFKLPAQEKLPWK